MFNRRPKEKDKPKPDNQMSVQEYRVKYASNIHVNKNNCGAKKTEHDGKFYHSKGEAGYAAKLDLMVKCGEIKSWQGQVKIPLMVRGILIANYYVDFKVITKHDTVQYHEYKGFETMLWKMKWKLFTALLPDIDPGAELIVIKA